MQMDAKRRRIRRPTPAVNPPNYTLFESAIKSLESAVETAYSNITSDHGSRPHGRLGVGRLGCESNLCHLKHKSPVPWERAGQWP
jgi:hypothetical protein